MIRYIHDSLPAQVKSTILYIHKYVKNIRVKHICHAVCQDIEINVCAMVYNVFIHNKIIEIQIKVLSMWRYVPCMNIFNMFFQMQQWTYTLKEPLMSCERCLERKSFQELIWELHLPFSYPRRLFFFPDYNLNWSHFLCKFMKMKNIFPFI